MLLARPESRLFKHLKSVERAISVLQDTCCFVDISGQQVNTTHGLAQALAEGRGEQALPVQLQPFDHILAPEGATVRGVQTAVAEGTAQVAVLYGAIGTACFSQMHQQLLDAAGGLLSQLLARPACWATFLQDITATCIAIREQGPGPTPDIAQHFWACMTLPISCDRGNHAHMICTVTGKGGRSEP